MARKILAGAILAGVCLAIGISLDLGFMADAEVIQHGAYNIGNFAEILSDTTNVTCGDSISFDCEYIYRWSISTMAQDALYRFKIAGTDSITGYGYLESLCGTEHTWEIAPSWVKVKAATNGARYTIRIEGWDAIDAGAAAIADTPHVY